MLDTDSLLRRAQALAAQRNCELTTVSKWLFGDWRRLQAIAAGRSFVRPPTLCAALERLRALEQGAPRTRRKPRPKNTSPSGEASGAGDSSLPKRSRRARGQAAPPPQP